MMNKDYLTQLLKITEQHLLAEFSYENTQKYKRRLQELIGKIQDEHPEYKESKEFKKLINATDEYLQKEISHERNLQYCRELSKFLWDILGSWRIESISSVISVVVPSKEEMEKLLPSSWPSRWEVLQKSSKNGWIAVTLGHVSPAPKHSDRPALKLVTVADYSTDDTRSVEVSKYDFIGDLSITGYRDKQTAREFFGSYQTIPLQGLSTWPPGATADISLGDLIKAFAPTEMVREMESALEKGKEEFAMAGIKIEKGKYLGEDAIFWVGEDGKRGCMAVLIDNFVITGALLVSDALEPGNTPIHSAECDATRRTHEPLVSRGKHDVSKCRACRSHKPCSTLEAEGFIHKEEVEKILRYIFSRIKEGKKKEREEINLKIERGGTKINNPKEKFKIKIGDKIKTDKNTQVTIGDIRGNKISIGSKTEVKIRENEIELIFGTILIELSERVEMLKQEGYNFFKVRTPNSHCCPRETIFSLYVDKNVTTLTVIKGKVEFSDLKGNKVIVKSNQTCNCSEEQGLQKPVTLSIDITTQLKWIQCVK